MDSRVDTYRTSSHQNMPSDDEEEHSCHQKDGLFFSCSKQVTVMVLHYRGVLIEGCIACVCDSWSCDVEVLTCFAGSCYLYRDTETGCC